MVLSRVLKTLFCLYMAQLQLVESRFQLKQLFKGDVYNDVIKDLYPEFCARKSDGVSISVSNKLNGTLQFSSDLSEEIYIVREFDSSLKYVLFTVKRDGPSTETETGSQTPSKSGFEVLMQASASKKPASLGDETGESFTVAVVCRYAPSLYLAHALKTISLQRCDVDGIMINSQSSMVCDNDMKENVDIYKKHGSVCEITEVYGTEMLVTRYVCLDGVWNDAKSTGTDFESEDEGGDGTIVVKKSLPKFNSNCPPGDLEDIYYTPSGSTAVIVTWTEPSATDSGGKVTSLKQTVGILRNGSFPGTPSGQQHLITYKATDNDGQLAFCYFSFTVQVRTCDPLPWPHNGQRECSIENFLGSICSYECNEGYQLEGNSTVTCQIDNNTTWTSIPTCEKISCGPPPTITNGQVECSNQNYLYNSRCTYTCNTGYKLVGQGMTACMADRSWFSTVDTNCIDDEPPNISCQTPQIFYADRASTSTSVTWIEPEVNDAIDQAPSLYIINPLDIEFGVIIPSGTSEYVTYQASDADGNTSPSCTIELRVLDITCGHPLDTLEDQDLRFNCSMSTHTYGDTCSLDCTLNLPLEGAALLTCEMDISSNAEPVGYWDWENGTMPFCRDIACPDINPPLNGVLVYDSVNARPIATMLCNEQFDIPDVGTNFNGLFLCQDSGAWNPPVIDAPDCIETFTIKGFRLPAEVFYYSGICGTDDNIHEQYENILAILHDIVSNFCETDTACTVINPRIVCGPLSKRRKRSLYFRYKQQTHQDMLLEKKDILTRNKRQADILRIEFDIQTDFNVSKMSLSQMYEKVDYIQLERIKPAIQMMVDNGTFEINSWNLRNDSFQTSEYGSVYCNPGYVVGGQTKCKACPRGYYENNDVCTICPRGEYSNTSGSTNCTMCQDGYSTRKPGSVSLTNCTELCNAGHYSPDTFAPCAPCKLGFYQSLPAQNSCTPCPVSTTTTVTGSTTESDCKYFDIIVNTTDGVATMANIRELNNLSVSFWTKNVGFGAPNMSIFISDAMAVSIQETIRITTNPYENTAKEHVTGASSSSTWIHVAVIWETTNNTLSIFYKGKQVINQMQVTPPRSPVVQNGQLSIVSVGTAVAITGFRLTDSVLHPSDTQLCHISDIDDSIEMTELVHQTTQGITIVTPSTCDAYDACQSNPCNGHTCTDEINGFTCTCSNGWTGITCNTPPDHCIDNQCQNGATCLNKETDYDCQCPPGYAGVFCNVPPVDGVWSSWSRWTDCSVTCNNGTRTRTRTCDSPPPDPHGQDCVGDDMELELCNTDVCPTCSRLLRGYGNNPECTLLESGTELCNITCKPGKILPEGLEHFLTYRCGPETDYEWEPRETVPDCTDPVVPERLTLNVSVPYETDIPPEHRQVVIDRVNGNTDGADCFNDDSCRRTVTLGNESNGSKIHSSVTTVTVTFAIDINGTSNLKLEEFEANNTVSEGLQELIDAVILLESTAQAINSSSDLVFDVTVDDITYSIESNNLEFDGSVICGEEYVATSGLCTICPIGTYKNGQYCSYCERGTYQELSGQNTCTSCPGGFTTVTLGSSSSQQCSVEDNTTTTVSTSLSTTTSITTQTMTSTTTTITQTMTSTTTIIPKTPSTPKMTTLTTPTTTSTTYISDTNGWLVVIIASVGSSLTFIVLVIIVVVLVIKFSRHSKVRRTNDDLRDDIHDNFERASYISPLGPLSSTETRLWESSIKERSTVDIPSHAAQYKGDFAVEEIEISSDIYMESDIPRVTLHTDHTDLYSDDYTYI